VHSVSPREGNTILCKFFVSIARAMAVCRLRALLEALRADFFCRSDGTKATRYRHERHPSHGETAKG